MKILLAACNAKYIHSNPAVYDLRAFADCYRDSILLREYTINQTKDEVMKDIFRSGADIVCFSCYIWNISYIRDLLPDLKKILPGTAFWAGGPEVSFDGENFLKENPSLTGIMMGEGESTFLDLAAYYLEGKGSLEAIPGIIYRRDDKMIHNGLRELMDLSQVPFTYEHVEDFANRIIYYESSRGCPFSCSYCLSSVDKKLRFRELSLVKKELQFFLDKKVPQVKFVDRTFNCRHDHAMEIWQYIYDHDNGITNFHFEVSADLIREEELELMSRMRPGLIQLEIGVQSTNPETIQAIRRTMNLDRLKKTVAQIKSYGNIHQHLDLIAGLPYEDYQSFRNSFCQVYRMEPDQLQLGFLKVLKGSAMYEEAAQYQILYKEKEPYEVLSTRWLSYEEILKLKMVESMVEVYYNSGQFQHTLGWIMERVENPFDFFESLGAFYEEKGYSEISHSRIRRYEILLEFLQEKTAISWETASRYMVYDLYLREKLKKRPDFASDQKPYERAIWNYRKANAIPKTAHIEVFGHREAVLFDYEKRNPLTNNAEAYRISLSYEDDH
ncbi:B12-binding domain-containing radical SAM protein [Blautia sp.]|uniref:Coproporphyrinogen III oxidase n=1 Tax=Blautia glucerasea TaxID=536633 RepID=A0A6N2UK22_9FIRM